MKNNVTKIVKQAPPRKAGVSVSSEIKAHFARLADIDNYGYSRHGASRQKQFGAGWVSNSGSPQQDIDSNIQLLRARSRDLYYGAPLPRAAIDTLVASISGAGLMLDAKIDYEYLGISKDQAAALDAECERKFNLWASSFMSSYDNRADFWSLQGLVIRSILLSGDVFVVPILNPSTSSLQVRLIEADLVSTPPSKLWSKDTRVVEGIELSDGGVPVNYYISKHYPTESYTRSDKEWQKVPAIDGETGERLVWHLARYERPNQARGVPLLAPVIADVKMLARYDESELLGALVSSYFTGFIKSQNGLDLGEQYTPTTTATNSPRRNDYKMGPAMLVRLDEGDDITFADPSRPSSQYAAFTETVRNRVGAALGIPASILIKRFQSSYTAGKAELIEYQRTVNMMRKRLLVAQFCQPVYEEWLAIEVAAGRIEMPNFFSSPAVRQAWSGANWYGMADGELDPLKAVKAAKMRVEEGFSTRAREAAGLTGENYEHIHKIRAQEEKMRKEDGLASDGETFDEQDQDETDE